MHNERKVLISPGFGAGWSTWADAEYREDMLFDPALIAAVESGRDLGVEDDPASPLGDFLTRMRAKHGDDTYIYTGGAPDLTVATVDGQFLVTEYDGSEGVQLRDCTDWH